MSGRSALLPFILIVAACLGVLALPALAQEGLVQPITTSGNTLGEVVPGAAPPRFVLASSGGEGVQVQIFGVSPALFPRFRVFDATGAVILDIANPNLLNTVSGTAFFTTPGAYMIEVTGEQGSAGQFVISLQPGAPPPAPVSLVPGQSVSGVVNNQTPVVFYQFSNATGAPQPLSVLSLLTTAGPALSLTDETTGRVIATSDGALVGATYFLAATNATYRLEVQAGGAGGDIPFSICLGCASGTGNPPGETSPEVPPPAETPEVSGQDTTQASGTTEDCRLTSNVGGPVNVRTGPDTIYVVIGGIQPGQFFPVTGQTNGAGWYQIDFNGAAAWAGSAVVRLEGNCANLPLASAPPNAPRIPTATPLPTPTPLPTATPQPTATPDDDDDDDDHDVPPPIETEES